VYELKTARYLLSNYPYLWNQYEELRENVLLQYRQTAFVEIRKNESGYSDTTGKKAVKLITLADYNRELLAVPAFLESASMTEKKVVLAVWRYGISFRSWWLIGKSLQLPAPYCISVWEETVEKLANHL